jgi:hypothetical protein
MQTMQGSSYALLAGEGGVLTEPVRDLAGMRAPDSTPQPRASAERARGQSACAPKVGGSYPKRVALGVTQAMRNTVSSVSLKAQSN